jgi:hypothetical protein
VVGALARMAKLWRVDAAFASETGSQQPAAPPETATVGRSPSDLLNTLANHLSLTEDQKSKILPIIIERQRKVQEVWTSSTLFVRQKQGQVRGINEDSDRRINALLTGDRQKAYARVRDASASCYARLIHCRLPRPFADCTRHASRGKSPCLT